MPKRPQSEYLGEPPESERWLPLAKGDVVGKPSGHPDGYAIAPHRHDRTQLLFVRSGGVRVSTAVGRWMVPAGHAMWIPAGVEHWVSMLGDVAMQSLYMRPEAIRDGPARLSVLAPNDLMRNLIAEIVDATEEDRQAQRFELLSRLLLCEIPRFREVPLSLPLPSDPRLLALCRRFLDDPSNGALIDDWAAMAGMSRRAFTRAFQRETGLTLSTWRQQACLLAALPRLADGDSVTAVALDLGYDSAAAFTTMFRRMLGMPPRAYFGRTSAGPAPQKAA